MPAVHLVHLEVEEVDDGEDPESDDPGGIKLGDRRVHGPIGKGGERCPSRWRSTVTIVAAPNISSIIACLWRPLETRNS